MSGPPSAEIRGTFADFFQQRDHRMWPSSSLIPNDPSLLLTVAGMVQFVPFFRGEATPQHPRAASVQKCVRISGKQDDIDNIGKTTRHLTFLEMLGNFSFGDYFKREAIRWPGSCRSRASVSIPSGCGPPSTTTTTRPSSCG
ncbi:MAG: alanine--tRNA ligase-related protein [Actinomycetota bacterium]|nr:alanine--tRNA ligase-related protein [Actinomycetota bacterium]